MEASVKEEADVTTTAPTANMTEEPFSEEVSDDSCDGDADEEARKDGTVKESQARETLPSPVDTFHLYNGVDPEGYEIDTDEEVGEAEHSDEDNSMHGKATPELLEDEPRSLETTRTESAVDSRKTRSRSPVKSPRRESGSVKSIFNPAELPTRKESLVVTCDEDEDDTHDGGNQDESLQTADDAAEDIETESDDEPDHATPQKEDAKTPVAEATRKRKLSTKSAKSTPAIAKQNKTSTPSSGERRAKVPGEGTPVSSSKSPSFRLTFSNSTTPERSTIVKNLKKLGCVQVDSVKANNFDVLVVGNGTPLKTFKLLLAVCMGKTVVTDKWASESANKGTLLDTSQYAAQKFEDCILGDGRKRTTLFRGKELYITPALKKDYNKGFKDIEVSERLSVLGSLRPC